MLLTPDAYAQDHEILRLKDGTEITGTIERLPDGGVRITDINGDIFVFSADEISQITDPQKKAAQIKRDRAKANSGYLGIVQTGIGCAIQGGFHYTIGMINGYKFNPWLYLGLGVDLGTTSMCNWDLSNSYYQGFIVPIYIHFRYLLLGGRPYNNVSPYIAVNLGVEPSGDSILYTGCSAGIQIKNIKKGNLWIAIDLPFYPLAQLEYVTSLDICLKVGWSF